MADAPDFDTMSRAELIELRGQLDKAITTASDRDRQKALKAAEDLAREHGFSLAELVPEGAKGRAAGGKRGGAKAVGSSPAPSEAKYRNPDNPEQTWSGRGRRPAWFSEALLNGRTAPDLEVR